MAEQGRYFTAVSLCSASFSQSGCEMGIWSFRPGRTQRQMHATPTAWLLCLLLASENVWHYQASLMGHLDSEKTLTFLFCIYFLLGLVSWPLLLPTHISIDRGMFKGNFHSIPKGKKKKIKGFFRDKECFPGFGQSFWRMNIYSFRSLASF